MSDDYRVLVESIDRYGADDEEGDRVRLAAERLGVEYLVQLGLIYDTVTNFDDNGKISYVDINAENLVSEETPGFELIYEESGMRLWRLAL